MQNVLRIGNASAFWGDSNAAPARLVRQAPDLDVLTLDYLAEVSMSILAKQRQRDPAAGFAGDFPAVIESLAPVWREGRQLRVIANAGGLNPRGCAQAVAGILAKAGCLGVRIGVVEGDDVLPTLRQACLSHSASDAFGHLETGQKLPSIIDRVLTANAYIGAGPVVDALRQGADIVITGRLADPSLTVAPCIAHFGWSMDDYARIAGATIAGHLIECGAQVTGGVSTGWLDLPDPAGIGYPIAEVADDGSCTITKSSGSGGRVNLQTVKEQLLYEIGDPDNYLSPDATVSFLGLQVKEVGENRVRVAGAIGRPPPPSYKVSATYRDGYRASGTLTIFGRDAVAKARRCGEMVRQRLRETGAEPQRFLAECLGAGAVAGVCGVREQDVLETVLRLTAADPRKDVIERFTREIAPLITTGPQGTTGYGEGRPPVREQVAYWPTLIPRQSVKLAVEIFEISSLVRTGGEP